MGILDRMKSTDDLSFHDQILGEPLTPGSLSTLDQDELPEVLQRFKVMIEYFTRTINDGSKKGKRTAFMINRLLNEAMEEINDAPAEMIEHYIKQSAAIMYWGATGERIINIPLPDDFVPPPELEPARHAAALGKPDPDELDTQQRMAIMSGETE